MRYTQQLLSPSPKPGRSEDVAQNVGVCLGVGSEVAARKQEAEDLYQAGPLPVPGWSAMEEGQGPGETWAGP